MLSLIRAESQNYPHFDFLFESPSDGAASRRVVFASVTLALMAARAAASAAAWAGGTAAIGPAPCASGACWVACSAALTYCLCGSESLMALGGALVRLRLKLASKSS